MYEVFHVADVTDILVRSPKINALLDVKKVYDVFQLADTEAICDKFAPDR